jgi:hypothetical protein
MAKRRSRGGPNKSQLIRDYAAANPKDGPQAIAEALKAQHGLTVTPQFISTVKSNAKRKGKKRGRKPGRPAGAAASASTAAGGGKLSMEVLLAARDFARKLGGVGKAKAAVDTLAKLLD